MVHGTDSTCRPNCYRWHGGSRALRFVELECPRCSAPRVNMARAYGRPWPCTCRQPEKGPRRAGGRCPRDGGNGARMVRRGAANIRITVPLTALTILDMPGRLHETLTDVRIRSAASTLELLGQLDESNFFRAPRQTPGIFTGSGRQLAQGHPLAHFAPSACSSEPRGWSVPCQVARRRGVRASRAGGQGRARPPYLPRSLVDRRFSRCEERTFTSSAARRAASVSELRL